MAMKMRLLTPAVRRNLGKTSFFFKGPKSGGGEGDLRKPALSRLHTTRAVGAHQAAGVVAHVPQGNKCQGHPGAVLRGNLVLSSHNGRDRPPATIQRKEAD